MTIFSLFFVVMYDFYFKKENMQKAKQQSQIVKLHFWSISNLNQTLIVFQKAGTTQKEPNESNNSGCIYFIK